MICYILLIIYQVRSDALMSHQHVRRRTVRFGGIMSNQPNKHVTAQ